MLHNPKLSGQWVWDAEKIFKYNGRKWIRIIHEPWTADMFWDIQVRFITMFYVIILIVTKSMLPDGGSPICIIMYADKTNLSSFGTAKGYPVVARIGNFLVDIRNGEGAGGGQLVGWLPIVSPSQMYFSWS